MYIPVLFKYVYHISYLSYRLWTRLYTDGGWNEVDGMDGMKLPRSSGGGGTSLMLAGPLTAIDLYSDL